MRTRVRTLTAFAAAGALSVGVLAGVPVSAEASRDHGGRFDQPQDGFSSPRTTLKSSSPRRAGLDPAPLEAAWATIESYQQPQPVTGTPPSPGKPVYPGAVLSYGHDGKSVLTRASGHSRLYADGAGTLLAESERIKTRTDTIYDMASVSKLFTSIVVMQQVEAGRIDLDAPAATYVPEFAANGKEAVTIRQMLTHTSGFPAFLPLYSTYPDPASRMQGALTAKLVNPPGTTYLYSDLNVIGLGEIAGRVSGRTLDRLVADGITTPLAMRDTGYNPTPAKKQRVAATEYQATPPRGMVWGEVHDENAWSLNGVAGHAGVFSTAADMGILAQTLLNGGAYGTHRILSPAGVQQMITDENTEFPGDAHGLGFELDQRWYMGGLSALRTAGHTGYTGTSLVIDFSSRSFAILLTNRVHPSRSWGSPNRARVAAAQGLAASLAVKPRVGKDAWFSGTANNRTATLTVPVTVTSEGTTLAYDQFVDTEETDLLTLQTSADDGVTWTTLPARVDGVVVADPYAVSGLRRWQKAEATVPVGTQMIRWTYTQDTALSGRGIYLDGVLVTEPGRGHGPHDPNDTPRPGKDRTLVDLERTPASAQADGWTLARR